MKHGLQNNFEKTMIFGENEKKFLLRKRTAFTYREHTMNCKIVSRFKFTFHIALV